MARTTYHHGDLRNAVTETAVELARSGGPEAVTLREVARRLDVSPAAIYRHYPDRAALLAAVARIARDTLARRMLDEIQRVQRVDRSDPREQAVRRFLATGRGYLRFTEEEPNLLATAFLPIAHPEAPVTAEGDVEPPDPWAVLAAALDELVATGAMSPERRRGAEPIAWSAVHGFGTLRATRSFEASGEPEPDEEDLLDAIARSLGVATTGTESDRSRSRARTS